MRARVRELVDGARAAIEAHRHRIDDLNVYPVPDGDTGTNLTLTVRAISEALAGDGPDDRAGLAKEVSRAALMGARGNSGVILSQIVRGATDSLAETDDLARAFRSASDAAYRAVKKPVEGTMLTAIRALADAAERGLSLPEIVAAGDETVVQTREMLPVLREAGVVDAGAAGLVEIVRGIAAVVAGEALPEAPEQETKRSGSRRSTRSFPASATARSSSSKATTSICRRSSPSSSRSATRCSSSATATRSRCTSTPTIRAARFRSASRAGRSVASRSRTCTSRRCEREDRLLHAVPVGSARPPRSSQSRPAPATVRSSRAAARSSSTAARR